MSTLEILMRAFGICDVTGKYFTKQFSKADLLSMLVHSGCTNAFGQILQLWNLDVSEETSDVVLVNASQGITGSFSMTWGLVHIVYGNEEHDCQC